MAETDGLGPFPDAPSSDSGEGRAWSLVIRPKSGWIDLNLGDLLHYRDLVWLFVKRDNSTVYKQTVLGPLWFIIQPIITTLIYGFVFGGLARLSTDGVPAALFYFGGTMLWQYYQTTLLNVSDTFVLNAGLFGKVYFPRLTVPIGKVLSNLFPLMVQTLTLAAIYIYQVLGGSPTRPGWGIIALPLVVLWLALLAMGIGMLVSALTKKYRDLRQLFQFGMGLWMYATPIVYPLSEIPGRVRWLMWVNPVTAPVELFRSIAFGAPFPPTAMMLTSLALTLTCFFLGLLLFRHNEASFVDVA